MRCPGPPVSCSPVCSLGVLCCVCGVLGHLASVDLFVRLVCCVACVVCWATWLVCTGVSAWCAVSRVRCPGALGSCSPVRSLGALRCVCGVLGQLAPVHRCTRSLRCASCAVSWATWLLFTGVPAWCAVLRLRCPGPLGSCSPVCSLGGLCRLCGVLGHLAPVHRCAPLVRCVACAVSWATWLLFAGVLARRGVLRVQCPGPVRSCSPVCPLGGLRCVSALSWATWLLFTGVPAGRLCCVCGVPGHLAPVHRYAGSVRCVACLRCPRLLGSCSPASPLGVLYRVCGVLGLLAPVHRFARSARCVACEVSSATWLLFKGVLARRVVLRVRCPGLLGTCSPVCPQRTQRKNDAGGSRQGQPQCGAPNGYHADRAHRRCLGGRQRQAQRARFPAGLHVPRAIAQ